MSSNLSSSFPQFKFGMAKQRAHSIYEFDGFRLEPAKLMLYSDGKELSLPPKAVEVLFVLVREQGQIVSKDDLIAELWSDSVVEESNLSQYLYLLRKTLGTRPDGTAYIETLRRRGYRFHGKARLVEQVINSTTPLNGSGSSHDLQTSLASARRPTQEHHDNVVALSDWKETERSRDRRKLEIVPPVPRKTHRGVQILGTVLLTAVAATTGYFLYSRNSAPSILAPPEITISRLTSGIEPRGATISPDGKFFVYHEAGFESRMLLQQVGYSNRVEIVPESEKPLCCTTFSPNSEFVYYVAGDSSGAGNSLYRVPKLGGPSALVVNGIDSAVSFSPDGREMVYLRTDREKNLAEYVAPSACRR